jgi:ABC-type multidrug transport system fused ATPase/permease subunit
VTTLRVFIGRATKFRSFLGDDVWLLFTRAIILGCLWFLVETSFLLVLQSLLVSLGLIEASYGGVLDFLPRTPVGASILLVVYGAFRVAVGVTKEYYAGVTNQVFIRTQRERIIRNSLQNARSLVSFEIIGMFTETVNRAGVVVLQMTQFTNIFVSALLLFVLGLKIAPIELVFGVLLLTIAVGPISSIAKHISNYGEELIKQWGDVNRTFHLGFKNFFFLSVNQMVSTEIESASGSLKKYEKLYRSYHLVSAIKNGVPIFAGTLILSIVMYVSRTYIGTSGANLISFFYIFIRISQAASEGNMAISNLKVNWPSFKSLYHWNLMFHGQKQEDIKDAPEAILQLKNAIQLNLEVKAVSFGYDKETMVFQNQCFSIKTGELLLIKGQSGTGKSTLVALLLGVLQPTSGEITINGFRLRSIKNFLAQTTGYVGPEPFLIPGSVRENLTYGLKNAVTDDDIFSALKDAQVFDDVMTLPKGLNELLNETTQLSTGQKQRLSIARAYLKKPRILVWDEATANLDTMIEQKCIETLTKKYKDLLVIVVSHKNSFDEKANIKINF